MNSDISFVHYRFANQNDLAPLTRLFDNYRVFYRQDSDLSLAESFLRERLRKQDSVIILAESSDLVVGFTQLYPSFSSVSAKRIWILNDLFIDEAVRLKGIGFGLLEQAREFAKRDEAKGLILATEISNETAQALYHKFGFVRDTTFYHYYFHF